MGENKPKGLLERLQDGDNIVIAEGYMWEFERRGYLKSGANVPEVVLEHPELVTTMHREYVHAGSDVVEAFTYYAHREKLRAIGREDDIERLNKTALRLAREVADETGTLMAGNLCNTWRYVTDDPDTHQVTRDMFTEQVKWAVEGGADYIIAETFNMLGEALLALDVIREHGNGLPAVVTITPYIPDVTVDDVPIPEACRRLEDAGAAVVGLNCTRGPSGTLSLIREIRKVCKGPIAAIPVPFRTTDTYKTIFAFRDEETQEIQYPVDIGCYLCNRSDVRKFAEEAREIGVQYVGLCCGNSANLLREVADVYGRSPPGMKYAPDMSLNSVIGEDGEKVNKAFLKSRRYSVGI